MSQHLAVRAGVDTGGTFTDIVSVRDGKVSIHKVLSTPEDPSLAIAAGIAEIEGTEDLIHGTTVATNALLERKGAPTALITTAGFEDLLILARQNRPDLYRLRVEKRPPLLPRARVYGVEERVLHDGTIEIQLRQEAIADTLRFLQSSGVESVAICLLHSWKFPGHEKQLKDAIDAAFAGHMHISVSHEIYQEIREYERACTTVVNALVGPTMSGYVRRLEERQVADRIEILQSSGGRTDPEHASLFPVHTILSGPAGGVLGARAAANTLGIGPILTFDMGGTSTDVSFCEEELSLRMETQIDEIPVHIPTLDVVTVGAGGGSIAWIDPGGALRVGPTSAGASPGPASYGLGGQQATVTDAHVLLGHLPNGLLGSEMRLDRDAAKASIARLSNALGSDPHETARDILDIANAAMIRALEVVSVERGVNPFECALVSFGGAGGLHACALADALEIPRVVVPRQPGLLSAWGMLHAPARRWYSKSILAPLPDILDPEHPFEDALETFFERGRIEVAADQYTVQIHLRYQGQSFDLPLRVDWKPGQARKDPTPEFSLLYQEGYGYALEGHAIEITALRVCATRTSETLILESFQGGSVTNPPGEVVDRDELSEDATFSGPILITEYSATTLVPEEWHGRVGTLGHLVLERR